jgi:hypothetical protein
MQLHEESKSLEVYQFEAKKELQNGYMFLLVLYKVDTKIKFL